MNAPENILYFSLGNIGYQAEKMQKLFNDYSFSPNENGYYLKFINENYWANNEGVSVETNCFQSEDHFNEYLKLRLLWNYLYEE